jgi:hypothetical protein
MDIDLARSRVNVFITIQRITLFIAPHIAVRRVRVFSYSYVVYRKMSDGRPLLGPLDEMAMRVDEKITSNATSKSKLTTIAIRLRSSTQTNTQNTTR